MGGETSGGSIDDLKAGLRGDIEMLDQGLSETRQAREMLGKNFDQYHQVITEKIGELLMLCGVFQDNQKIAGISTASAKDSYQKVSCSLLGRFGSRNQPVAQDAIEATVRAGQESERASSMTAGAEDAMDRVAAALQVVKEHWSEAAAIEVKAFTDNGYAGADVDIAKDRLEDYISSL